MKKTYIFFAMIYASSLFALEVTTSIIPQKYFIEKIGQDRVKVNVMVESGFSPATYEPKTSQMKKLSHSTLYFSIGVPFENVWLQRFKSANSSMHIIDTTNQIKKQPIQNHTHEHRHEQVHKGDENEHETLDPHVWLDPLLVKIQAKSIYEALAKYDAKNRAFYQKNYEQFIEELTQLNLELEAILKPLKNRAFMVFHPSWGYFAKRFDLEQIAVEIEGKQPKPNQLIELIETAKKEHIKVVFVAPQFSKRSAQVIAKNIQGSVVVIDSLEENWAKGLLKSANAIANSYE